MVGGMWFVAKKECLFTEATMLMCESVLFPTLLYRSEIWVY